VNPKDIEAIAIVMREQHGSNAEEFVRRQILYHRDKPVVSTTWKAVLDQLLSKPALHGEARNFRVKDGG
jgi:hypothetical protein